MKVKITESQFRISLEGELPYLNYSNINGYYFAQILKSIGAPVTRENMAFMYAWRECENSLGGASNLFCNNPFNTSWDMDPEGVKFCSKESKMYCRTNSAGVKSYKTLKIGVEATIKTILSGNYDNLLYALRNSKNNRWNCLDMAQNLDGDLNKWGTMDANIISKCKSYLKGATPSPALIVQVTGCK